MTRARKVHVASLHHWLGWPTMAVHLESEIRVPWDPIHDILPRWRMADDPAFIAFKPAAEHREEWMAPGPVDGVGVAGEGR